MWLIKKVTPQHLISYILYRLLQRRLLRCWIFNLLLQLLKKLWAWFLITLTTKRREKDKIKYIATFLEKGVLYFAIFNMHGDDELRWAKYEAMKAVLRNEIVASVTHYCYFYNQKLRRCTIPHQKLIKRSCRTLIGNFNNISKIDWIFFLNFFLRFNERSTQLVWRRQFVNSLRFHIWNWNINEEVR